MFWADIEADGDQRYNWRTVVVAFDARNYTSRHVCNLKENLINDNDSGFQH